MTERTTNRRVVANIGLTLDGCYQGPRGRWDHEPIASYAKDSDIAADQMARTIKTATTAVLGRVNAEHFLDVWPPVAGIDDADPRHKAYSKWFVSAEKIVLSRTVTTLGHDHVRIVNAPAHEVIAELKTSGEGDILINHSASVIKALLAADTIDQLNLIITPEIAGGEHRLFDEALSASKWQLVQCAADHLGVIGVTYDRIP